MCLKNILILASSIGDFEGLWRMQINGKASKLGAFLLTVTKKKNLQQRKFCHQILILYSSRNEDRQCFTLTRTNILSQIWVSRGGYYGMWRLFVRRYVRVFTNILGTAVAQWLRFCATNRKVTGSIPTGVIGFFRLHCGPGVDSVSNRHEYQEHFLGGKGGRCVRLTT
jgi:hypothetical protein